MKTQLHIMIAAEEEAFRSYLKSTIKIMEGENNVPSIVISEAADVDGFEAKFAPDTDVFFIDALLILKDSRRLGKLWEKLKINPIFVLLLSDKHANEFKKILYRMEKQKSLPLDVYILKNNYPEELIRRVVMHILKLRSAKKNHAATATLEEKV